MTESYRRLLDGQGRLRASHSSLDSPQAVSEAVRQLYGMVWALADLCRELTPARPIEWWVEWAERHYRSGLMSAGISPD